MDTTPLVPLVGDRNVALNHFILWMADHQRLVSFLCGMGPQGEDLLRNGCVGWDHRDKMDGALRNLLMLSFYSP